MSVNLGIANVKVELYSDPPHIVKNAKKYNFDVSAYNWKEIQNSSYMTPFLAEYVEDDTGTFAAIHPSKRKNYVDNYLKSNTNIKPEDELGKVMWEVMDKPFDGIATTIVTKGLYDIYEKVLTPDQYANAPDDYKGPMWYDEPIHMEPPPNDELKFSGFIDIMNKDNDANDIVNEGEEVTTTTTTSPDTIDFINTVFQARVKDGLWWAIESNAFLDKENTPFWVNFKTMNPPSSSEHETCFIIRIGPDSKNFKFDIFLSFNRRPRLIDYVEFKNKKNENNPEPSPNPSKPENSLPDNEVPQMQKEWPIDLSRMVSGTTDMEVGIMIIAGRLVVIVNNIPLVYTRINREAGENGGKLLECKIPPGKIQIFATNVQTRINVCPMVFAETSIIALPLPAIVTDEKLSKDPTDQIMYKGCDFKGVAKGSIAELPTPPTVKEQIWGVDCRKFLDLVAKNRSLKRPKGQWLSLKGNILFSKASKSIFSAQPSTDFHTVWMYPDNTLSFNGVKTYNSGCPYFFRLKGLYDHKDLAVSVAEDISQHVISVDETAQAPDYFHAKKSASITFYNPNNEVSDKVINKQTAISISWGWDNDILEKTFTGIVTSISKSEIAGQETVTLNCEDYMFILNSMPIINSPFYDGMVAYYAIKDLAERAGIGTFINDFKDEDDYFLPAGYSFSQPVMRFQQKQVIFECMMDMIKRFEAYVFFDGEGRLHIAKLPGGLFSKGDDSDVTGFFTTDIRDEGSGNTILEERSVDIDYNSTVNCISILTLERDTRNAIIYAKTAAVSQDKLTFLKTMLIDQPAYGALEVAKAYAEDLSKRVFFPILKTRFKVAGSNSIVNPLEFVTVDDHMFRVMSVKRSFNADTNDFNCSYECEWLGGA